MSLYIYLCYPPATPPHRPPPPPSRPPGATKCSLFHTLKSGHPKHDSVCQSQQQRVDSTTLWEEPRTWRKTHKGPLGLRHITTTVWPELGITHNPTLSKLQISWNKRHKKNTLLIHVRKLYMFSVLDFQSLDWSRKLCKIQIRVCAPPLNKAWNYTEACFIRASGPKS